MRKATDSHFRFRKFRKTTGKLSPVQPLLRGGARDTTGDGSGLPIWLSLLCRGAILCLIEGWGATPTYFVNDKKELVLYYLNYIARRSTSSIVSYTHVIYIITVPHTTARNWKKLFLGAAAMHTALPPLPIFSISPSEQRIWAWSSISY